MQMKMWCLCRIKDRRPIIINCDDLEVIGFATKKDLIKSAGMIEGDEVVKRITFKY